jgi:hypothetical protein
VLVQLIVPLRNRVDFEGPGDQQDEIGKKPRIEIDKVCTSAGLGRLWRRVGHEKKAGVQLRGT